MFQSHRGGKKLFSTHLKSIFHCFDRVTFDIRKQFCGTVNRRPPLKGQFLPQATSSRFTHVYYKREKKKRAFFASNIILAIFFLPYFSLTCHGLPSSYVDCTFYITCSCEFFLFLNGCVYLQKQRLSPSFMCRNDSYCYETIFKDYFLSCDLPHTSP